MLAKKFFTLSNTKGRERNGTETRDWKQRILPKRGNPQHETVTYEIGGTFYEVSTSCDGSELLYDKMKRLIKEESGKTPTDKKSEVRYNENSNLFVGRSLQEEWTYEHKYR